MDLPNQRMNTAVERVFRALPNGLFKEIYLHYIHFLNEDGSVRNSKLDKQIEGKLYKLADKNDRSLYGDVEYTFPGDDKPVRLVALGMDMNDQRYGRF
jgi:hypothetical protein